jgi:hypothetical protein
MEDVKEIHLIDENMTEAFVHDQSSSKEQSHPEGTAAKTLSMVSTSKSQNKKEDGGGSISDVPSYEPGPTFRTPKKKLGSSMQINLDKDSNSKKLESKFKLDSIEEQQAMMILEGPVRRLIVQNFEIIQEEVNERRHREHHRPFDAEGRTGGISDLQNVRGSILSVESNRDSITPSRFSIGPAPNKPLPVDRSSLCNPCTLI